jgi:hypothetical protein
MYCYEKVSTLKPKCREVYGQRKSGQELLQCPLLKSGWQDSNLRPLGPKPSAIPGYATPRASIFFVNRGAKIYFLLLPQSFESKNDLNSFLFFCDPGWNRTSNLLLRRQLLYPIELRDLFYFLRSLLKSFCYSE